MPLLTDDSFFPFIRDGRSLRLNKIVSAAVGQRVFVEWDTGDISCEDANLMYQIFPKSMHIFLLEHEAELERRYEQQESKEIDMEQVD